jgi:hypothetical protein
VGVKKQQQNSLYRYKQIDARTHALRFLQELFMLVNLHDVVLFHSPLDECVVQVCMRCTFDRENKSHYYIISTAPQWGSAVLK